MCGIHICKWPQFCIRFRVTFMYCSHSPPPPPSVAFSSLFILSFLFLSCTHLLLHSLTSEQAAFLAMFVVPLLLLCCIMTCGASYHVAGSDTVPTGRVATPPSQPLHVQVYRLSADIYSTFLEREEKALVLISPSNWQQPLRQFYSTVQRYVRADPTLFRLFYFPVQSHRCHWVEEMLGNMEEIEERDTILNAVSNGGCVVLMMLVQKKKLYLLPCTNKTAPSSGTSMMEDVLGLGEDEEENSGQFDEEKFSSQLQCWLNRVMDGTQRYYKVEEWPQQLN